MNGGEGREERGMEACTNWDFRKSASVVGTSTNKANISI